MKIEISPRNLIREKVIRKQRPIDKLITLALSGDDEDAIAKKAQAVLEEIRLSSELTINQQLSSLEKVAHLPNLSDTDELQEAITDTAEHLSDEIKTDQRIQNKIGLSATLAALYTWDEVRAPETEALCVETLNNFRGESQPILAQAFVRARDENTSYREAHVAAIEEAA